MKNFTVALSFLTFSVILFSCTKEVSDFQGTPLKPAQEAINKPEFSGRDAGGTCPATVTPLFAGQTINAGSVTVTNDSSFIYVTYLTANGYTLTQTHLYVGNCALIPVNNPGNPIPGQFPYKSTHSNLTSYTYAVPISAIGINNCGCIAAHAVVVKLSATGQVIDQQTAWGDGIRVNLNGNWATNFAYCPCL